MTISPAAVMLDTMRTPSGALGLLALDQRESLRRMFPPLPDGTLVDDEAIVEFKKATLRALSPQVHGVLLDIDFGIPAAAVPGVLASDCRIILAADVLHAPGGDGVVQTTDFDERVDVSVVASTGATAVKHLAIWRADTASRDHNRREVDRFLDLARRSETVAFVEGIVRPPLGEEWRSAEDRAAAIISAAEDLGRGADVYKAEVPGYRPGTFDQITEQSKMLSSVINVPWVVLSNGVQREDFADAVAHACDGGASGFLAGRAIWADTVTRPDTESALRSLSVPRIARLQSIIDERACNDAVRR